MPLERLEKRILADAESRAGAIGEQARSQAEKILGKARAEAAAMESAAKKSADGEAMRLEAEQAEAMDLQERSALLEARNRAVEAAVSRLRALVTRRIKKREYGRIIAGAIEEASRIAPQDRLTLVISKNDARLVKKFGGRIRYGKAGGGIELRSRDGNVRMVTTIERLFDQNRQRIETMLINDAFGKRRAKPARQARKRRG